MPDWLKAILPDFLERALSHQGLVLGLSIGAGALFLLSIIATPWLVARLPRDYFKRRYDFAAQFVKNRRLRVLVRVVKNVLGGVLLLAGLLMLVIPGPGILCILAALVMLDFPGKHSLERKIVQRPRILRTMNKLRRRMGKKPLVV